MDHIRLTGSEDGALVLESTDGTSFRLSVDEAVKAAVRKAASPSSGVATISPREIQEQVRAGKSVQDIAEDTGAEMEYLLTFALPVLDELEHMVASARAVRLTIPGDRFNDDSQVEFGDLVDGRLQENGASEIVWASSRVDGGVWLVSVTYAVGKNSGAAKWIFDPRKVTLTPEDESASALSVLDLNPGPIPKVRVVTEPPKAFRKDEDESPKTEELTTGAKVVDLAAARNAANELLEEIHKRRTETLEAEPTEQEIQSAPTQSEPEAVDDVVFEDDFVDDGAEDELADEPQELEADPETDYEALAPVTSISPAGVASEDEIPDDSIEALAEQELAVSTSQDLTDVAADEPEAEPEPESEPIETPAPKTRSMPIAEPPTTTGSIDTPRKGRASMPSWDEIVFGTKADGED